ncbi:hypothetical protein GQ53DRAFT_728413 [Thozetella sp. PMI_491]|nr:hypothetical protein GQ53DRAFT_728413 [Thozetella sp. PMI_491]
MPGLPGFTDNSLRTREDVIRATEALVRPLAQYLSPGCGRVKIPHETGTHFDEAAAQLEGFSRPFWAIGALLMGGSHNWELLQPWLNGFETGTDPHHVDYWGPIIYQEPCDQRMVEAEMISFALLASPRSTLWERLSPKAQRNLTDWLLGIHGKFIHPSNWLWFRVFVNLALLKVCGVDSQVIRDSMDSDLEELDKFYMTDGWSSDGLWRSPEIDDKEYQIFLESGRANAIPNGRQACYYSGSFAIQFSQLLYVRFASDLDPQRAETYRQRAREFGRGFSTFFDAAGAPIPFGRSLTYRFACSGFFAALALARVPDMPEPLASPGAIKGYLLRNLRWWAKHSAHIFYPDGILNFGWTYPQMYLTENYNSPQSVYWALKSLVVVGLTEDEAFWKEAEIGPPELKTESAVRPLPGPRQLLCNHPGGNHHFMLSTAQFVAVPFKAIVAKYSKFAYSSSFGFSVPTGSTDLAQLAPDNTLALSRDGTETWAVKHRCAEPDFTTAMVHGTAVEEIPIASVQWYPWVDRYVSVHTTILPPTTRWPDWHVRIHRITAKGAIHRLFTSEGGFAIHGRRRDDTRPIPLLQQEELTDSLGVGEAEGILGTGTSLLLLSEQGASGIATELLDPAVGRTAMTTLKPEPNTNVMRPRTLIPLVDQEISRIRSGGEVLLVTKVFAVSAEANGGWKRTGKSLRERWLDQPSIRLDDEVTHGDHISIPPLKGPSTRTEG